jgi:hypothetical protein
MGCRFSDWVGDSGFELRPQGTGVGVEAAAHFGNRLTQPLTETLALLTEKPVKRFAKRLPQPPLRIPSKESGSKPG